MLGWRRRSGARGGVTAFIDEGSEIDGRYAFTGTAMLNGRFSGEIDGNGTLIIGERARVSAEIRAGRVVVSGEVVGNIRGAERVELRRPARVAGDIEAATLVIEEGVVFDGRCQMGRAGALEPARAKDPAVVALVR